MRKQLSNLVCAGNKVFVKYQTQGGLTPNPPRVRRWLFRIKWTIAEHNLKHAYWTKGLQKVVVRWFLDADDNPDSH